MVVTDDPALAATFRSLRNQGRDEDGTWLRHVRLGYNYRLDELSAAIGVAQLERLDELRPGARASWRPTSARSADSTGSGCPQRGPNEIVDWFVYVVRLDRDDRSRPGASPTWPRRGSRRRPYFSPIHLQPFYRETVRVRAGRLPGHRTRGGLDPCLAVLGRPADEDVAYVAAVLIDVVGSQARV